MGRVGLNGNWGVPMSVPLGHLSEDVCPQVLSKADSQDLKSKKIKTIESLRNTNMRSKKKQLNALAMK